jgi:hypothetical protein
MDIYSEVQTGRYFAELLRMLALPFKSLFCEMGLSRVSGETSLLSKVKCYFTEFEPLRRQPEYRQTASNKVEV